MPNRISYPAILVSVLLFVAGCVSVDSRVWKEAIDKEATLKISGEFSNSASYFSTGEFLARNNLADLLNVPAKNAGRVRISFEPNGSLKMTWFSGDKEIASRTYEREFGLAIAPDGAIDLPSKGHWASGEGAVGYQTLSVRLFVNGSGDLATIQSGGGAGLLGPIPLGIYAKHLAVFSRAR